MTRIAVVDDHALFREGLIALLRQYPEIQVVAQGSSPAAALMIAQQTSADVLLLDIELSGESIVPAMRAIRRSRPELVIICLSMYSDRATESEVRVAGACALVSKAQPVTELVKVIRECRTTPWQRSPEVTPDSSSLTDRELAVLLLVRQGLRNKEIAGRLLIVEGTVRRHVGSILQKLDANSRGEAVAVAERLGLFVRV